MCVYFLRRPTAVSEHYSDAVHWCQGQELWGEVHHMAYVVPCSFLFSLYEKRPKQLTFGQDKQRKKIKHISHVFPLLTLVRQKELGPYSFLIFSVICLATLIYTWLVLPETKNHTFLEISQMFAERNKVEIKLGDENSPTCLKEVEMVSTFWEICGEYCIGKSKNGLQSYFTK